MELLNGLKCLVEHKEVDMKPLYILATCSKKCSTGPQIKALIYKDKIIEKGSVYYRFTLVCLKCHKTQNIKQNKHDMNEIFDAMNLFEEFWVNIPP